MPRLTSFTREDILRSFDRPTIQKGERYQKSGYVHETRENIETGTLTGRVQGSEDEPYATSVYVRRAKQGTAISGFCTCPVSYECKHVVATLLEHLQRRQSIPAPVAADKNMALFNAWLREIETESPSETEEAPDRVLYVVETTSSKALPISAHIARPRQSGGYGTSRRCDFATLRESTARYVRTGDPLIATLFLFLERHGRSDPRHAPSFIALLDHLLATGRFHADDINTPPLRPGPPRTTRAQWVLENDGSQRLAIAPPTPATHVLIAAAPWYVDRESGEAGSLAIEDFPARLLPKLAFAPRIAPENAARARTTLERRAGALPIPLPETKVETRVVTDPPTPVLRLVTRYDAASSPIGDEAQLTFDYGGSLVSPYDTRRELLTLEGTASVRRLRSAEHETAIYSALMNAGLRPMPPSGTQAIPPHAAFISSTPSDPMLWWHFQEIEIPRLRELGWRIEIDPGFTHLILPIDNEHSWEAELLESDNPGWFDCEVGIQVGDNRVSLLPILLDMLRRDRHAVERFLAGNDPGARIFATTPKGAVALPVERVRGILETFLEALDPDASSDAIPSIPLHRAAALQADESSPIVWKTPERVRETARKLASFAGIAPVDPPEGLHATLRPYQHEGVSWLQFLREYGFGGILADDMGLGKTLQTLAHLLIEKEAGRLTRPALLVVPTSLLHNWIDEAARFTPSLRVLPLHGPDRETRFPEIERSDLVITTYPLLPRDEILEQTTWHTVVLDEAQMVKNSASKGAQTVRRLRAEHRLCLTGTPIENHLGELWTQFEFLMPGTLGDKRRFGKLFRTPIEKHGDATRRVSLSRRVRPFILRRTKNDVLSELPPKTEIVRRVELENDQRDLYETIRLAMHDRVRRELAERGLARSRIIILDALLKLRQACCDPRLVKVPSARKVKSSAKLDELREMLPQLVEEGRRILIFSQFTSMLDLVEPELERLSIPYVQIRGTTKDRRTPVARFQSGEVPVFLISLKAGGTGLNLTAADTVIHLDPWWNPAVERQATDRAHRIGQTNNVFVYKLIAAGTVEERILELQERKAAIAEGLFDENAEAKFTIETADLERLFAPIK